jgi:hypothetical protein
VFVALRDGVEPWRQVAVGIKPAADGSFSFTVHEGLSYIAAASFWDPERRQSVSATVGPFVVQEAMGALKLVLSSR